MPPTNPPSPFSAAILAGGHSRRMGQNKAGLPLGKQTLIERVVAPVQALAVPFFFVAADPTPYASFKRPIFSDIYPDCGPLGGLHTALTQAQTPAVLLLACDLPFLTQPFLSFLADSLGSYPAVVPKTEDGRFHPLCAMYSRSCLPTIETALTQRTLAMTQLCQNIGALILTPNQWRPFDPAGKALTNINTPEDLKKAHKWLSKK